MRNFPGLWLDEMSVCYCCLIGWIHYKIKFQIYAPIYVCAILLFGTIYVICNMYEESPVSLFMFFFLVEMKWRIDVEDEKMWEWGQKLKYIYIIEDRTIQVHTRKKNIYSHMQLMWIMFFNILSNGPLFVIFAQQKINGTNKTKKKLKKICY